MENNTVIQEWVAEGVPEVYIKRATLQALSLWDFTESYKEEGKEVPMGVIGDQTARLFNSFTFKSRGEFNVTVAEYLKGVTEEEFKDFYLDFIIKHPGRV